MGDQVEDAGPWLHPTRMKPPLGGGSASLHWKTKCSLGDADTPTLGEIVSYGVKFIFLNKLCKEHDSVRRLYISEGLSNLISWEDPSTRMAVHSFVDFHIAFCFPLSLWKVAANSGRGWTTLKVTIYILV